MLSSGRYRRLLAVGVVLSGLCLLASAALGAQTPGRNWINHLDLLPGDASVRIWFDAAGDPKGGVAGLVITSATAGNQTPGGGDKVVWMALSNAFFDYVVGIDVCYQVYNTTATPTSIDLIRVARVLDPPSQMQVMLEDATDRSDPGPVCALGLILTRKRTVNTWDGPLYLFLRVKFASPDDVVVIRGVCVRTWL